MVANSLLQTVELFHWLDASLLTAVWAAVCFCVVSVCLIALVACASVCWVAAVFDKTSNT